MLSKEYNAFEHLWRSIFPITAKERLMAMLVGYFDESGTHARSPIVGVGGFVSTVQEWGKFQTDWNQMLANEGLEVFHASHLLFSNSKLRIEKGWDQAKVESIFQRADTIIKSRALFGAMSYVHTADCEELFPLDSAIEPRSKFDVEYAAAGIQLIKGISGWARDAGYTEKIKYVFEDGAAGRPSLFDTIKRAANNEPLLRKRLMGSILPGVKDDLVQLQAADKLINASRRTMAMFVENKIDAAQRDRELINAKVDVVFPVTKEYLTRMYTRGVEKKNTDI